MSNDEKGSGGGLGDAVQNSWLANSDSRALLRKKVELAAKDIELKQSEIRINNAIAMKTEADARKTFAEAEEIFARTDQVKLSNAERARLFDSGPAPLAIEDQRSDESGECSGDGDANGGSRQRP